MKTILTLALTFAAAAATLAGSPAVAQDAAGAGRILVSHADLDLRTETGIRILDRRIRTAVAQACGPTSDFDPVGKNRVLQCRADTLAVARAQRDVAIAAATASPQVQLASQR